VCAGGVAAGAGRPGFWSMPSAQAETRLEARSQLYRPPFAQMMNLETRAPMPVVSVNIPAGDAGTSATIAAMRQLIDEGKKDPVVYELARTILRRARVRAFDVAGEARAIYESVRRNLRFTRDIRGKETLHSARELVRLRMGDCDDYTILMCSLLESIGLRARIKTVANDERDPETFTHVFPEVSLNGKWVAVDAARRQPAFGKAPRFSFRTRVWDTQSPEFMDVAGLNGLGAYVPGPAPGLPGLRPLNPRMPARLRAALGSYARPPAYAPRGQGNYGLRPLRGVSMGDDSSDQLLTELPNLIQTGEVGAANIITAVRANPNNLVPTTSVYGSSSQYSSLAAVNWTPWLLIGGVGLVAVLAMRGR
jgi:hypothetical protein